MQVHYFAVCLKFGKMSMLSDLTATCCICPALSSVLLLLIREAGIHFCVVRAFYVSLKKNSSCKRFGIFFVQAGRGLSVWKNVAFSTSEKTDTTTSLYQL